MATCKDCLHFEICKFMYGEEFEQHWPPFWTCDRFKDRSRFVELPCKEICGKQGDDIYIIDDGEVLDALLYAVGFDQNSMDAIESATDVGDGELKYHKHRFADIGKTVFLNREEAEAELARRKANG